MKKYSLLFLLFLSGSCISQVIEEKNPFVTTDHIRDIVFIDENTGWLALVDTISYLLKTTDGGTSWEKYSGADGHNISITVISEDTLIIHTSKYINGDLVERDFMTQDGALSWRELFYPIEFKYHNSYFLNGTTGFIYSDKAVLRTSDTGQSWSIVYQGSQGFNVSFSFLDEINGWASFGGNLMSTSDGGINWTLLTSLGCSKLKFFTPMLGYCTSGLDLIKTTDGGYNWNVISSRSYFEQAVHFIDSLTFFVVSGAPNCGTAGCPEIRKSTDGGFTWQLIYDIKRYMLFASFINSTIGYFGGTDGYIGKMIDGETIKSINGDYIFDAAVKEDVVILAGEYGRIYRSENRGEDWIEIASPINLDIRRAVFINNSTVLAFADSITLRSTDAGLNWIPLTTGIIHITDYHVFDDQTVYVTSRRNCWYKSEDAGLTWHQHSFADSLISIYFLDSLSGYITSFTALYKTTDGGEVWKNLNAVNPPIKAVRFFNENHGMGAGWAIWESINGGYNWSNLNIYSQWYISDAFFFSPDNYYVLGTEGPFFDVMDHTDYQKVRFDFIKVIDGEDTSIYDGYGYNRPKLEFASPDYGWLIAGRTILCVNSTIPVQADHLLPVAEYNISQNYPNPFNPATTIQYSVPVPGFVSIKLYDVLGKEIRILISKDHTQGNYSIEFNAERLSSGVYLYKITAGNYSAVKKMQIIK